MISILKLSEYATVYHPLPRNMTADVQTRYYETMKEVTILTSSPAKNSRTI